MLLELSKNVASLVSNPPKMNYFSRIRFTAVDILVESEQHGSVILTDAAKREWNRRHGCKHRLQGHLPSGLPHQDTDPVFLLHYQFDQNFRYY